MSRKPALETARDPVPPAPELPPRPTQAGSWTLKDGAWVCLEGPHLNRRSAEAKQPEAAPADLSPEQEV